MGFEDVAAGLDIGSTNMKALAITRDGRIIGRTSLPTPRREHDLMIDAHQLLDQAEILLRDLCGARYRIAAISIAGIGEDGMLVARDLVPLTPAMAWFDPRRQDLFNQFAATLTPCPASGISTDAFRTMTGWYWAVRQQGHERAHSWLALTDYVASFWSGRTFMSDTLAARSAAFLPKEQRWCHERVEATLGTPALLPPIKRTGDIVGPVRGKTALVREVFTDSAMVVAGGHDHPIGGWGISQIAPRAILDSMGTAEVIVTQSADFPIGGQSEFDVAPGIRSQGATLLCVEELARNLAWARREPETASFIDRLFSGAETPDSYLESACFERGSHGGGEPGFREPVPDKPLSRASAIVGALARAGNDAVSRFSRLGTDGAQAFMAGGWARAPGWVAIKTRLSTQTFHIVREPELTAASAALLAARAIGWSPCPRNLLMPCDTRDKL
ncbi:FGGY family carbohydrate kinase [Asaia sp. HN010]|uniref:FGGY family carbohydrate kinase n=1 Tax=Asaia sp. HN010 TaxID=3081233 RepID=UPI003019A4DE